MRGRPPTVATQIAFSLSITPGVRAIGFFLAQRQAF
jgi:hypothetical protein